MPTTEKRSTSSELRRGKTAPGSRSGDRATSARCPGVLDEIFARQRAAIERNPAPLLSERRANLLKLQRIVEQNRVLFIEAAPRPSRRSGPTGRNRIG
ncbi:hypothetical protein AB0F74_37870, partial [Nocardia salmonicida]